eukprot:2939039-Prorocentrum_lima.AAC.1
MSSAKAHNRSEPCSRFVQHSVGKFVQKSMVEQNVVSKDEDGEDVAALWHKYIHLTSQANMLGLGQQVPPRLG